jgi:hypothetical protein
MAVEGGDFTERGGEAAVSAESASILLEIQALLHRLMHATRRDQGLAEPPPLLDLVRRETEARRRQRKLFGRRMPADPRWDVLLHLFELELAGEHVTVSTASRAAAAPLTTVLRHIDKLADERLLCRRPHPHDARSTCLTLTAAGRGKMEQFFAPMM